MPPKRRVPLLDSYSFAEIAEEDFWPIFKQYRQEFFAGDIELNLDEALSESEQNARELLSDRLGDRFTLYLGIYHQDTLVGWSFGKQESAEKYYMVNSALLPLHRNKGVYTSLLPHVLERVKREGFQIVYSRHRANNNPILIPKLKAGFCITGLELSDMFGTLVHLSYFFNQARRSAYDFRVGTRIDTKEMKRLFSIK